MLHHPDHATKAFSTPGCEKLLLPMVLDMPLFWAEVQVLNFQRRKGKIPFELYSHWEHHFSTNYLSESTSRAAWCALARRPGQGGLTSRRRQAVKHQSGDIKEQERHQEGGCKPANCNEKFISSQRQPCLLHGSLWCQSRERWQTVRRKRWTV